MSAEAAVRYPDGNVLLRTLSRELPVISHGTGIYLFDQAGRRYLDASSGALVASLGHGVREIAAASAEQLARVGYVNGTQFTSAPTEDLAARLCALAARELPRAALTRAAFLCSGSEAIEAAVKFARQLCVERGEPARTKLVARTPSYHGNTLYALSLSGRPHYKKLYGPLLSAVLTVPAPDPYRGPQFGTERQQAEHHARELEALLLREGPETVAAFLVEPVSGSSLGAAVPPEGYFALMRDVCTRYGVLLIADEVLCGAGRVGRYFASAAVDCVPDLLVLGKGLGGGYAPVSALLVRGDHVDAMRDGSGAFQHAQTYLQAPFLTAVAGAVLSYYEQHDIVGNAQRMGLVLQRELNDALAPLPLVGHVQGMGLLAGVELVADKRTRAPFPRAERIAERLTAHLFDRGLIVWPNVGHVGGAGDLFLVAPPLVISEAEVHILVSSLHAALSEFQS